MESDGYRIVSRPGGAFDRIPITPEVTDSPAKLRGLGDVIAAATKAVGIKPCEPCRKRQEALNRLVPFNSNEKPPSADQLPAVADGGEKSEDRTT
jgi:hypothetical protein